MGGEGKTFLEVDTNEQANCVKRIFVYLNVSAEKKNPFFVDFGLCKSCIIPLTTVHILH